MIEVIFSAALYFGPLNIDDLPRDYIPPIKYDYPFPGTIYVLWQSEDDTRRWCPRAGVACTIETHPDQCLVIINEAYRKHKNAIIRHENGHCNGWTH